MTITFKVSNKTIEQLNKYYADLRRPMVPPYAIFQAQDGDSVVTLYESGKIVFQGRDADLASQFWVETEKQINKDLIVNNSDNKKKEKVKIDYKIFNSSTIGSDEVGTGDYFGPIVVTATYVSKDDIEFVSSLGVKDSKQLTDEHILKVVPELMKRIPYSTYILNNKKYNQLYEKGYNMNSIKAMLHNKVLCEMTKQYKSDYIVVDQFVQPELYYKYLKGTHNICDNITFMIKGENKCLSVGCASMISRYIFLKEFDKLSKKLKMPVSKGASNIVDDMGYEIVNKLGMEKLYDIAKLNFKNTEKIKKKLEK